jgi:hypothetical protein
MPATGLRRGFAPGRTPRTPPGTGGIANGRNKTRTAAALGITFRALRYKLKKLGID